MTLTGIPDHHEPDNQPDDTANPDELQLDTPICTVESLLQERDSPLAAHFARLLRSDSKPKNASED
jgi:hypothetical protein